MSPMELDELQRYLEENLGRAGFQDPNHLFPIWWYLLGKKMDQFEFVWTTRI